VIPREERARQLLYFLRRRICRATKADIVTLLNLERLLRVVRVDPEEVVRWVPWFVAGADRSCLVESRNRAIPAQAVVARVGSLSVVPDVVCLCTLVRFAGSGPSRFMSGRKYQDLMRRPRAWRCNEPKTRRRCIAGTKTRALHVEQSEYSCMPSEKVRDKFVVICSDNMLKLRIVRLVNCLLP